MRSSLAPGADGPVGIGVDGQAAIASQDQHILSISCAGLAGPDLSVGIGAGDYEVAIWLQHQVAWDATTSGIGLPYDYLAIVKNKIAIRLHFQFIVAIDERLI